MLSFFLSLKPWIRRVISLVYLSTIALLSLLPSQDLPEVPLFPGADKLIHVAMYIGLAGLTCWTVSADMKPRWYTIILIFAIGWGILMELFQLLMHAGRALEVTDMIANSVGAVIGVLIYRVLARWSHLSQPPQ